MKASAILILTCSIILSCQSDQRDKVDPNRLRFNTTDASELFFKNVRSVYYDQENNEAGGLYIFRKKGRIENNQNAIINLAIVHAWKSDQAFLILEPNVLLAEQTTWIIEWTDENGRLQSKNYAPGDIQGQTQFAVELYNLLLNGYTLKINSLPAFVTEPERENFRITVKDFLYLSQNM
jgi:hypothetical protein